MTLQELQNQKRYVRVIASTNNPTEDALEMIGGEYEVRSEDYFDATISVWDEDKSDYWVFNKSDVMELTPVEFQDKKIAIGDKVRWGNTWYIVYDYYWSDGEWVLKALRDDGNLDTSCYAFSGRHIQNHLMPQDNTPEE